MRLRLHNYNRTHTSVTLLCLFNFSTFLCMISLWYISGCSTGADGGYKFGNLYDSEFSSVAVPIFENQTLYTGLERELTDALIKEFQARTPYLVKSAENADTILIGTITHAQKERLSTRSGTGLAQEIVYKITVDFQWKNIKTGKNIVVRENFQSGDIYIPSQPVSEHPDMANYAIVDELARAIVSTLQESW